MTLETLERHTQIAFDLMCGLRGDQSSQAYIHAAKAWVALDAMQRKAKLAAKKAAKVETPNTEPAGAVQTTDTAPRRGSSRTVM